MGGNRKQSEVIISQIPEERHCFCMDVASDHSYAIVDSTKDHSGDQVPKDSGRYHRTETDVKISNTTMFSYLVFFLALNFGFPSPHQIPLLSPSAIFRRQKQKPF